MNSGSWSATRRLTGCWPQQQAVANQDALELEALRFRLASLLPAGAIEPLLLEQLRALEPRLRSLSRQLSRATFFKPMTALQIQGLLHEGKAKKVFTTDRPGVVAVQYKDDATAFNAQKAQLAGKGLPIGKSQPVCLRPSRGTG